MLGYVRCIYENLGDVAVDVGVRQVLGGVRLWQYARDSKRVHFLGLLGKELPFRAFVLGGGTLIFSPEAWFWDVSCLVAQKRFLLVTVGSGVVDPILAGIPDWVLDFWCQEVLAKAQLVTVRGRRSQSLLASRGITSKVLGDPVFFIHGLDSKKYRPVRGRVGLNWGMPGISYFRDKAGFLDVGISLIRRLFDVFKEVLFFAVCEADVKFYQALPLDLRRRMQLLYCVDVETFSSKVVGCEVFVGLKLHSVLLALISGVPSLMVSYQPKCEEVMEELDLKDFLVRVDEFSDESVSVLLDQRERLFDVSDDLKQRVERYRQDKAEVVRELRRIVGVEEG